MPGRQGRGEQGAAKSELATSKGLADLPDTDDAVSRGDLSPQPAAMATTGATADPTAESKLLDTAKSGNVRELNDQVARTKAAADPDPDATQQRLHRERFLRLFQDLEGACNLTGKGSAADGARLKSLLDPMIDELFHTTRQEGRHESRQAYAWDAMVELLRRGAGHDTDTDDEGVDVQPAEPSPAGCTTNGSADPPEPNDSTASDPEAGDSTAADPPERNDPNAADELEAGDPTAADDSEAGDPTAADPPERNDPNADELEAGDPTAADDSEAGGPQPGEAAGTTPAPTPKPRQPNLRHLALLRVDLQALVRGHVTGDELCEIAGLGPIPATTARALLGDAILRLVITRGVDVLNVTNLGRGATAAQQVALLWFSPTCIVAGCTRPAAENDHQTDWAQTKRTDLADLNPKCGHHHDLKTYHGWSLVPGKGRTPMVPPDDPRHPANAPPQDPTLFGPDAA